MRSRRSYHRCWPDSDSRVVVLFSGKLCFILQASPAFVSGRWWLLQHRSRRLSFGLIPIPSRSASPVFLCSLPLDRFSDGSFPNYFWDVASSSLLVSIKMSVWVFKIVRGFWSIVDGCCIFFVSQICQTVSSVRASCKPLWLNGFRCFDFAVGGDPTRPSLVPVEADGARSDVCSLIAGRSDTWWEACLFFFNGYSLFGLWPIVLYVVPWPMCWAFYFDNFIWPFCL